MDKKANDIFNNKLENYLDRKYRKVLYMQNMNDKNNKNEIKTNIELKNESIKNSSFSFIFKKIKKNHDDIFMKNSLNESIKSNTFKIDDFIIKKEPNFINASNINTESHKNNSFSRYNIDNYNKNESDDINEMLKEKIFNLNDNTK